MHARIAVLPGDGVGPEVTDSALAVLRALAERFNHHFEFTQGLIGGAAIDAVGDPLPPETIAACSNADAVLLGAVGGPQWSHTNSELRPEQGLLRLRRELGVYANVRPVTPDPSLIGASPLRPELLDGVDVGSAAILDDNINGVVAAEVASAVVEWGSDEYVTVTPSATLAGLVGTYYIEYIHQ